MQRARCGAEPPVLHNLGEGEEIVRSSIWTPPVFSPRKRYVLNPGLLATLFPVQISSSATRWQHLDQGWARAVATREEGAWHSVLSGDASLID